MHSVVTFCAEPWQELHELGDLPGYGIQSSKHAGLSSAQDVPCQHHGKRTSLAWSVARHTFVVVNTMLERESECNLTLTHSGSLLQSWRLNR